MDGPLPLSSFASLLCHFLPFREVLHTMPTLLFPLTATQVEGAVTEGNMCVFVMDSYRRFGQAFLRDAYAEDARVEARERSVDVVSPASDEADCDGVVELEYGRSEERAGVVVMVGEEAMAPPSRGGNMLEMMKQAMPEYERLEHAVDM